LSKACSRRRKQKGKAQEGHRLSGHSRGTYLTAVVPSGATTGFVTITTSSGSLQSNKIFRVNPQIKSFTPTSGPAGTVVTVVTITGVSLTQTTKVTLGENGRVHGQFRHTGHDHRAHRSEDGQDCNRDCRRSRYQRGDVLFSRRSAIVARFNIGLDSWSSGSGKRHGSETVTLSTGKGEASKKGNARAITIPVGSTQGHYVTLCAA
jgi:hypothetical protein